MVPAGPQYLVKAEGTHQPHLLFNRPRVGKRGREEVSMHVSHRILAKQRIVVPRAASTNPPPSAWLVLGGAWIEAAHESEEPCFMKTGTEPSNHSLSREAMSSDAKESDSRAGQRGWRAVIAPPAELV